MSKVLKTGALTALLLTFAASAAFAQDKMAWKKDYKEALKAAKKDGKLVVVHFWADW